MGCEEEPQATDTGPPTLEIPGTPEVATGDGTDHDGTEVGPADVADGDGVDPDADVPPTGCTTDEACEAELGELAVCEVASCDLETGACVVLNAEDGRACDDADACTENDSCVEGECTGGTAVVCEGEGPCVAVSCDAVEGCQTETLTGSCDDGDACTIAEACQGSDCVGITVTCPDDGESCTSESCDPAQGCVSVPLEGTCDDGNACSLGDTCVEGKCTSAGTLECPADDNPCDFEVCDPFAGCISVPGSFPCDDGDSCTENDGCIGGVCAGVAIVCPEDDQPCTEAICDQASGCGQQAIEGSCEDGDVCTEGEICLFGLCTGGTGIICEDDTNACTFAACDPLTGCGQFNLPIPCDDGDTCTVNDTCTNGECTGEEVVCEEDGNPCTTETCFSTTGCNPIPNILPCNDGDACSALDTCTGGVCIGQISVTCSDDGNPCTSVYCDSEEGCLTDVVEGACDDGDECTSGDVCAAGVCVGDELGCVDDGDGNPCTEIACVDGECQATLPGEETTCDDGDVCTGPDLCVGGSCTGEPLDCDDGEPCTNNECVAGVGCIVVGTNDGPCDDGSLCSENDVCVSGTCKGDVVKCDDLPAGLCKEATCMPSVGCVLTPMDGKCDDGDPCTPDSACVEGVCTGLGEVDCDLGEACTEYTCEPGAGCVATKVEVECDDGDGCTVGDYCDKNGVCAGVPLECPDEGPCLPGLCDVTNGGCTVKLSEEGTACEDGDACTLGDLCDDKANCVPGEALECVKTDCADFICDAIAGCVTLPIEDASCDDGSDCTVDDACVNGECVATPVDCSDSEDGICVQSFCVDGQGCKKDNLIGPCQDGDICTVDDTCQTDGECVGAAACIDDDPCNEIICDETSGECVVKTSFKGEPCDDGNPCTLNDVCGDDFCEGELLDCSTGNVCLVGQCDISTGTCVSTALTGFCDDDNPCTTETSCTDAVCGGGKPVVCEQGDDVCLAAICVVDKGCDFVPKCSAKGDEGPCEVATCDEATGECGTVPMASGDPCDDGNVCTNDDFCGESGCEGTPVVCLTSEPCTKASCEPAEGCVVEPTPSGEACDDGDICTVDDACTEIGCYGSPKCKVTDSFCDTEKCDEATGDCLLSEGLPCDDGDACTEGDTCVDGSCVATPIICPEGGACTTTKCDATTGCYNEPDSLGEVCDDGDLCTSEEVCTLEGCVGTTKCDTDGSDCTLDECDPLMGFCTPMSTDGLSCDDGDLCTWGDSCEGGLCKATAYTCDDDEACAPSECDGEKNCVTVIQFSGEACDDGDPCTSGDACLLGGCEGAAVCVDDGDECTEQYCVEISSTCETKALAGTPCDDGDLCTVSDTCVAGHCDATPVVCDVGDVCDADTGECMSDCPTLAACLEGCDGAGGCVAGCGVQAAAAAVTAYDDFTECMDKSCAGVSDVPKCLADYCEASHIACYADCEPDCGGKTCGDDGCGSTCGTCDADDFCSAAQVCGTGEPASCDDFLKCALLCDDEDCLGDCMVLTSPGNYAFYASLAACSGGLCDFEATSHEVKIGDMFDPADLEITAGDTVVWTNTDTSAHTATSDTGDGFDSGMLSKTDAWSYTFEDVGIWDYYCAYHPSMTGSITVTEAASETACLESICPDPYLACTVPCVPACDAQDCGDDGCGGTCGSCDADYVCNDSGVCEAVCKPACDDLDCGDDGCGGVCGTCAGDAECKFGLCVSSCTPACDGLECGDDSCGGECGSCSGTDVCQSGLCKPEDCAASCDGLECGDDGCGGDCGTCGEGYQCKLGLCAIDETCVASCDDSVCGSDGCGGSCGDCDEDTQCVEGQCKPKDTCEPACDGLVCGDDGCGGVCGTCSVDTICVDGACNVPLTCDEMATCMVECVQGGGSAIECGVTCEAGGDEDSIELFKDVGQCLVDSCLTAAEPYSCLSVNCFTVYLNCWAD